MLRRAEAFAQFAVSGNVTDETGEPCVGASSVINVILQSDNRFLDEVVVVAYDIQKKKDVTGSITDVKSEIVAIQNKLLSPEHWKEQPLAFESLWSMVSLVSTWQSEP